MQLDPGLRRDDGELREMENYGMTENYVMTQN